MVNIFKMQTKYCHMFEVFKHKNQQILCQIRLSPRRVKYHSGQISFKTYHWMHPENWADFEYFLQKKLNEWELNNEIFDKIGSHFLENGGIKVILKKSKNSIRTQCKILDERKINEKSISLALDCSIYYKNENIVQNVEENEEKNLQPVESVVSCANEENDKVLNINSVYDLPHILEDEKEQIISQKVADYEYEPQFVSKLDEGDDDNTILPYIPYIPSSINNNINDNDDEEYHPESIIEEKNSNLCETSLPSYKPTTINSYQKDEPKISEKLIKTSDKSLQVTKTTDNKLIENKKHIVNDIGDGKKQSEDMCFHIDHIVYSTENLKADTLFTISAERLQFAVSPKRNLSSEELDGLNLCELDLHIKSTPNLPSIKEKDHNLKNIKPGKTRNLFGSDDDEDDEQNSEKTVHKTVKFASIPAFHKLNKINEIGRKRKHQNNYDTEKNTLSKWLRDPIKSNRSRSKSTRRRINNDMSEQRNVDTLSDQMEKNILNQAQKNLSFLTLNDLDDNELINSLHYHKPILDELFHKLKHETNIKLKGYNGINHLLVIGLLDHNKQLAMMNKLSGAYDRIESTPRAYHELYVNVMLPEWIVCIFMKKYKFTREEAIARVKAQDEYRLHRNLFSTNSNINQ